MAKELIKDIKPRPRYFLWLKKYFINRYTITLIIFLIWMVFFDNTSFLVINDLNQEITKYQKQLDFYKSEYEKNNAFYKKLMNNKAEKEKFARENYFMKKRNEEIFIIVSDSTKTDSIEKK